jgi:Type I phosphodiesterase / nucleotide pyrophosphatase
LDSIVAGNALLAPLDAACHGLLRKCHVWKECLFAPPIDLSIRTFRERLLNVAADDRPLVVLAVDAIPYRLAKALWSPDWLIPLASVFPSTSSVAWPCIVSGQGPETTGVPGVVYRDAADRLYHCFRHAAWGRGKPDQSTTIADVRFSFAPLLFDDFGSTHDCKLIAGDLAKAVAMVRCIPPSAISGDCSSTAGRGASCGQPTG